MCSKQNKGRGGGPKTQAGKEKALANLIPAKPGEVRNPKGRPSAGAAVREWWNIMQGWPLEKVKAVQVDPESPVNKIMAARAVIDACSTDRSSAGQPIAGNDLDRIIDYTAGKPTQAVEVSGPDKGPIETKKRVDFDAIEQEIRDIAIAAVATRVPADDSRQ